MTVALSRFQPHSWNDSVLAEQAIRDNLSANRCAGLARLIASTDTLDGRYGLVLLRLPKSHALLEHQLAILAPQLQPGAMVIAGGMTRHMQPSMTELLERYIGPTEASLAKRKARLLCASFQPREPLPTSPWPHRYQQAETGLVLNDHAGVFSAGNLDIGTRLLLAQMDRLPASTTIADLGCGNGLLGICAQRQFPQARLTFTDCSYLAIASAADNYRRAFPDREALFCATDLFNGCNQQRFDLVLCNPPFHYQHTVDPALARRMFRASFSHLNPGGALWVVANRHLKHHLALRKLFGHCDTVAGTSKFVVFAARR